MLKVPHRIVMRLSSAARCARSAATTKPSPSERSVAPSTRQGEDVFTQALWRQVQALVHTHRGRHAEAEALAREAVAVLEPTDALNMQGDALYDLGEVLATAGHQEAAASAFQEALARYERKQIIPLVRRTRERLAALQAPTV